MLHSTYSQVLKEIFFLLRAFRRDCKIDFPRLSPKSVFLSYKAAKALLNYMLELSCNCLEVEVTPFDMGISLSFVIGERCLEVDIIDGDYTYYAVEKGIGVNYEILEGSYEVCSLDVIKSKLEMLCRMGGVCKDAFDFEWV